MNWVVITLFLAFTLFGCKNISDKEIRNDYPLPSIINDFENQLEKDIKDDNLNGSISAAIIHKNKIIWSKAFGVSDIEEKIVADTNTIFRTPYFAQYKFAEILNFINKSVPGNIVSVWFNNSANWDTA